MKLPEIHRGQSRPWGEHEIRRDAAIALTLLIATGVFAALSTFGKTHEDSAPLPSAGDVTRSLKARLGFMDGKDTLQVGGRTFGIGCAAGQDTKVLLDEAGRLARASHEKVFGATTGGCQGSMGLAEKGQTVACSVCE